MKPQGSPSIIVIAGTNGAGKSSVAGETLRKEGSNYYNPDEAARILMREQPWLTVQEANAEAWEFGRSLLEKAISLRTDFAFETTLGGSTITGLLERAAEVGLPVRMWYVGLDGPELHIARVRARVAAGGHDIPEAKIRERFDQSRTNLIRLLPSLSELHLFDNSGEGDPESGGTPRPRRILDMINGTIIGSCEPSEAPGWCRPIIIAALRTYSV